MAPPSSHDLLGPPHHPAAAEGPRAVHAIGGWRMPRLPRLPFRILIADGGADDSVAQLVAEKKSKVSISNTSAIRSTAPTPITTRKLADALSRVTTPFVVMADNDDLFIPDGLTRAVEFLPAHPSTWPAAGNARCSGSPARARPRGRTYGDASTGNAAASSRPMSPIPPGSACASVAAAPTTSSTPCTAPICCAATSRRCGTAIRATCS